MSSLQHNAQFNGLERFAAPSANLAANQIHSKSDQQYFTIIATSYMPTLCQSLIEYQLQKGDIIFCSIDRIAPFLKCNAKFERPLFLVKDLPIHNPDERALLQQMENFIIVPPAVKGIDPVIEDTLELIDNYYARDETVIATILERFISILQSESLKALRLSQRPETMLSEAFDDQKITMAISLIHANLSADWSVERLASDIQMPVSKFLERFQTLLSVDLHTYVTRWRLQKSISLLDETRLPILNIVEALGFASEDQFRELFSDSYGFSPEQYRKKPTH